MLTRTRSSVLRPLELSDFDAVYSLFTHTEMASRWRFRGRMPSPEMAQEMLWRGVHSQFVIAPRTAPKQLAGLVSIFDVDFSNQIGHLSVVVDPRLHGSGWPLEAAVLFVDHVFRSTSVRKLYAETPGYSAEKFAKSAQRAGFVEEGRLREYEVRDGECWDVHILALSRERYMENQQYLMRLVDAKS